MIKRMYLALTALVLMASCSDDDVAVIIPEAGTLSGGPFTFILDGNIDNVSGISTDANAVGSNKTFVITDLDGKILGLPGDITALEGVDFDGAGEGTCLIWYLRYENGLIGLEVEMNTSGLEGNFDFSNSISVFRNVEPNAGNLSGGPFIFAVDGMPDFVSGITKDADAIGANSTFIITDEDGKILGLPGDLAALEGVDFDGAGEGTCLIWYLKYEEGLTGLEEGMNAANLQGVFSLSDNSIEVVRKAKPVAGMLTGGPFTFCVDGQADTVNGIGVYADAVGTNSTFVVTDDKGKILGLPLTMEALEGVNFDGAGPGECFIWYLRYEGDLVGLEMGMNTDNLDGIFSLSSNSISVTRNEVNAGTISGGDFTFTVDGMPDYVSGITIDGSATGKNSKWVITDEEGKILGLPDTLAQVEGVDFDGAGSGVCLIWYLRYEDGLIGAAIDNNAGDLEGCFALSNPITVTRN